MLGERWYIYKNQGHRYGGTGGGKACVQGHDHRWNGLGGERCLKVKAGREGWEEKGVGDWLGAPGRNSSLSLNVMCVTARRWHLSLWRIPMKIKKPWNTFLWKVSSHLFSICHVLSALLWKQSHYSSPRSQRQLDPPGLAPSRPSVPPQWKKSEPSSMPS